MPTARTDLQRDTKVVEILDAAEAALEEGGYNGMSVAQLARTLGLAQNSVYWYFGSKDDLFAAVVRRILERLITEKPSGTGTLAKILWTAAHMERLAPLRTELRARSAGSAAVAALNADLDAWIDTLLTSGIRGDSAPAAAGDAFRATVEGAVAMRLSSRRRRAVIALAYDRLTSPESSQ